MSKKRKPRPGYGMPRAVDHKNAPVDRVLAGPIIEVQEYGVVEWCPPGSITPSQVHFHLTIKGIGTFIVRLKGPEVTDQLINMFQRHRDSVWPDVERLIDDHSIRK